MSLNKKIITLIIVVVVACAGFWIFREQKPLDLSMVSDEEIVEMLSANQDSKEYILEHSDFIIKEKIVLTPESILAGQNGENFKEVYQDLSLEDNRYLKVDLMNQAGANGLVVVLDFKDKKVIKAFGVLLLKAGN